MLELILDSRAGCRPSLVGFFVGAPILINRRQQRRWRPLEVDGMRNRADSSRAQTTATAHCTHQRNHDVDYRRRPQHARTRHTRRPETGQRYEVELLVVGTTTVPRFTVSVAANANELAESPRRTGQLAGASQIPATALGSAVTNTKFRIYTALVG